MYDRWLDLKEIDSNLVTGSFNEWFQREEKRMGATLHWTDTRTMGIDGKRTFNRNTLRKAFLLLIDY